MIKNLLQIQFPTHNVHISQDDETGSIICFKYDGSACDFQSFSQDEELQASDWMMIPLPIRSYRVIVLGDESE